MKNLKRVLPMLLALIMVFALCAGTSAFAAGETVKIICPYGAGGVADLVTREYAKAANNVQSDYNFIVENLTGGDGFVANATFSEEDPSTMDLLVMGYGVCYRVDAAAKYDTEEVDFDLTKNVPFCTIDDRTWIMFGAPGTTLADVLAKAKDGGIKMSGGNPLSDPHLALGTLILAEGGKVQPIPYDGGAEQKKGLTDGEVDVFVGGSPVTKADVEAGTLVPLLAFSDKPFEGFVGPDGNAISVPCICGEGKAPELNADNDYSASILAGGGGLATHEGCDPAFREAMIETAKKVWADEEFSGWVAGALLNNFQKYGDEAVDFYGVAREKAMNAYAILFGE
ncbi:MAG: hypothetical protein IKM82_08495 [Oscillospiraceae bacterium]|nr:hypothetical protein [Oscillospiraceae bacterium]